LGKLNNVPQIKLRRDERKILKEWNTSDDPIVRFKVTLNPKP